MHDRYKCSSYPVECAGSAGSHVRQGGVGRVTRRSVSVFSPASDLHSFTQHTESSVKYYDLPNIICSFILMARVFIPDTIRTKGK